ncbi:hypothetical protein ACWD3J_29200 [Streptomyces sp. NPDC002755]|uniref:hypothetical protein n=1 Tax=Streptomyces sp. NPDC002884 TaxID=3154544 RepID=UPI00331C51AC
MNVVTGARTSESDPLVSGRSAQAGARRQSLSVLCGMMIAMDTGILTDVWQRLLADPRKSWVLFEHGTCVVVMAPDGELAEQATEILKKYGPAHAGSSSGDFGVIDLKDAEGWVVTGQHNDVLTYVGPDEPRDSSEIAVGLFGRSKRHRDGTELHVVHVEDNRGSVDPG